MVRLLGVLFSLFLGAIGLCVSCLAVASPALRILEPLDSYVIEDDQVDVIGAFALKVGTEVGVAVNGVRATVVGRWFLLSAVPLQPGSNTISVAATGEDGTTTRTITVWSTGKSLIKLTMAVTQGTAPLRVALTAEHRFAGDIARLDVDFGEGAGATPASTSAGTLRQQIYARPGIYIVRVTVTLVDGSAHSLARGVAAIDPDATDARLKTIWNRFVQALANGDKPEAMSLLTRPAQAKYEPVFDALLAQMPPLIESLSPIQKVALSPELGEYIVTRTIEGASRLFFVHFLLDIDGIWRLEDM